MGKLRLKGSKKRPKREQITAVTLEDGTVVTDPDEVNRLLRINGFTVDPMTGKVGLGPALLNSVKPS